MKGSRSPASDNEYWLINYLPTGEKWILSCPSTMVKPQLRALREWAESIRTSPQLPKGPNIKGSKWQRNIGATRKWAEGRLKGEIRWGESPAHPAPARSASRPASCCGRCPGLPPPPGPRPAPAGWHSRPPRGRPSRTSDSEVFPRTPKFRKGTTAGNTTASISQIEVSTEHLGPQTSRLQGKSNQLVLNLSIWLGWTCLNEFVNLQVNL